MFDLIDCNDNVVINEIMMMQSKKDDVILVVEGKEDKAILQHHTNSDRVSILYSHGKCKALAGARHIRDKKISGVFFLVDLDYDDASVLKQEFPSVVFSTSHDLFMDVVISNIDIICKVISFLLMGVLDRNNEAENDASKSAVQFFKEAADLSNRVAVVSLKSRVNNLNLKTRDFPFGALKSINPSNEEIAEKIRVRSSDPSMSVEAIADLIPPSRIDRELSISIDEVRGILSRVGDHTFISALCKVMSHYYRDTSRYGEKHIRSSFLAAISCECLEKVGWFRDLHHKLSAIDIEIFSCPECSMDLD